MKTTKTATHTLRPRRRTMEGRVNMRLPAEDQIILKSKILSVHAPNFKLIVANGHHLSRR